MCIHFDMVGSSTLSTRLDPEEQRDVIGAFQSCCANEIMRLAGMVAQYLGDGVLAYFGFPAAYEDDAERAVRAGLAILDVVRGPLPSLAIPSTLHASLHARLDRLAAVKDVAQTAVAIGREFSYSLIAAVAYPFGEVGEGRLCVPRASA